MTRAQAPAGRRAGVIAVVAACLCGLVTPTEGEPPASPPRTVVAETRASLRREHVVRVTGDAPYFSPRTLVVRAGDMVRWQSEPVAEVHSVHELKDASFVATIHPGEVFTHRFSRPGEFEYGCRFHPWMRGHVTVLPYRVTEQPVDAGAGSTSVGLLRVGERVAALVGPEPRLVVLPEGRVTPGDALPRALRVDAGSIAAVAVAPGGRAWLVRADGRIGWHDPGTTELHWSESTAPASPVLALAATDRRVFRMTGDGRLWSTGIDGGPETAWPLPAGAAITLIAADGDRLWCVDRGRGKLFRIDGDRVIERSLPPALVAPTRLAVGPEHAVLLIAGQREDRLARLSEDGQIDEFELDTTAGPPTALAMDSAGRGWLIRAGRIARFELPDLAPLPEPDPGSRGTIPGETRPSAARTPPR